MNRKSRVWDCTSWPASRAPIEEASSATNLPDSLRSSHNAPRRDHIDVVDRARHAAAGYLRTPDHREYRRRRWRPVVHLPLARFRAPRALFARFPYDSLAGLSPALPLGRRPASGDPNRALLSSSKLGRPCARRGPITRPAVRFARLFAVRLDHLITPVSPARYRNSPFPTQLSYPSTPLLASLRSLPHPKVPLPPRVQYDQHSPPP